MWQQLLGKELITEEGGRVKGVYPGRISGDSGPDFREAIIAMDGSHLLKGDVEVHVKSGDWYNHGHHSDPEYNNVILHVVLWQDCSHATLRQDGKSVPVLCLATTLRHQAYLIPYHELPCFQIERRVGPQVLARQLNIAGEERFKQKAMHFQAELEQEQAKQVLWKHLMRALGYSKNIKPFEELAHRASLNFMENVKPLILKQAWLVGTAGLLPSQRSQGEFSRDDELRELEHVWRSVSQGATPMRENDWNLWHIYPNNSPIRRIVAQSYLLERYYDMGLLRGMLQLVEQAWLTSEHRWREDSLTVFGDGYWQDHFDFDIRSKTRISALLGKSKASEIVVNVILPFAFSWGEMTNEPGLKGKAIELYNHCPKLSENGITRHMARQLSLKGTAGFTACHQQGLIHIFRDYCREGKCCECPLVN
jgi:hypothetical protein